MSEGSGTGWPVCRRGATCSAIALAPEAFGLGAGIAGRDDAGQVGEQEEQADTTSPSNTTTQPLMTAPPLRQPPPAQVERTAHDRVSTAMMLWQEGQHVGMPRSHDSEVAKVEGGNLAGGESFGQGNHGRVGGSERQVCVLLDQLRLRR
jgi:hypothetical protein